jgi:hypothetical protein
VFALVIVPYWVLWAKRVSLESLADESLIWVPVLLGALVAGVVAHEALHAIGFMIGGAAWEDIKFGVKMMNPYAHCKVPLRASAYRLAITLPGIVLGVLPGLIGIITGMGLVNLFGAIMLSAALGDALILWLLRDTPRDALVYDHPSEIGCEVVLD